MKRLLSVAILSLLASFLVPSIHADTPKKDGTAAKDSKTDTKTAQTTHKSTDHVVTPSKTDKGSSKDKTQDKSSGK